MKKILLLIMMLVLFIAGCGSEKESASDKLQVAASFYPVAEFVRAVGGERVSVQTMVADGVEPHDWEPSGKDLTKLSQSKLFFYNGGVEHWASNALNAVNDAGVKGVEIGKGLYEEDEHHTDPHVWLSPRKAMLEVEVVCKALCEADAANTDYYRKNAENYLGELQKLDAELRKIATAAQKKTFITTHAAFGHLAEDYGLEQQAIMGLSPGAEPTPAALVKLAELIEQKNIKVVFFETLVSPRVAQAIAESSGIQTLVLDPLEGLDEEGRKAGDDYLKIMKRNIKNLEIALNGN